MAVKTRAAGGGVRPHRRVAIRDASTDTSTLMDLCHLAALSSGKPPTPAVAFPPFCGQALSSLAISVSRESPISRRLGTSTRPEAADRSRRLWALVLGLCGSVAILAVVAVLRPGPTAATAEAAAAVGPATGELVGAAANKGPSAELAPDPPAGAVFR